MRINIKNVHLKTQKGQVKTIQEPWTFSLITPKSVKMQTAEITLCDSCINCSTPLPLCWHCNVLIFKTANFLFPHYNSWRKSLVTVEKYIIGSRRESSVKANLINQEWHLLSRIQFNQNWTTYVIRHKYGFKEIPREIHNNNYFLHDVYFSMLKKSISNGLLIYCFCFVAPSR